MFTQEHSSLQRFIALQPPCPPTHPACHPTWPAIPPGQLPHPALHPTLPCLPTSPACLPTSLACMPTSLACPPSLANSPAHPCYTATPGDWEGPLLLILLRQRVIEKSTLIPQISCESPKRSYANPTYPVYPPRISHLPSQISYVFPEIHRIFGRYMGFWGVQRIFGG